MKTRQYLHCIVRRNDGTRFVNELKMSESHLIKRLAKENMEVLVNIEEVLETTYKSIFGS